MEHDTLIHKVQSESIDYRSGYELKYSILFIAMDHICVQILAEVCKHWEIMDDKAFKKNGINSMITTKTMQSMNNDDTE